MVISKQIEQLINRTIIKNCLIGSRVIIDDNCIIKDCIIPDDSKIGNKTEIENLLSQCDPTFFDTSEGKGWSFLNFCQDGKGELWTGVHKICDCLICLGLAIGKVNFLLPRELWDVLPGGVPYLQITGVAENVS